MKIKILLQFLLCVLFFTGCLEPPEDITPTEEIGEVDGIKPIYTPLNAIEKYSLEGPKPIVNLGKIYYKDPYIFVNESSRGVHIIDNNDPTAPKKISFLNIPGNNDIAIKDNYLYADNIRDMVIFDISDINEINFVNRVFDINPNESDVIFPSGYTGWFECIDDGQGEVVGWEEAILVNPSCFK